MAGVSFDILFGVVLYLMSVWGAGRLFKMATLPAILGELLAGIERVVGEVGEESTLD